MISKYVTYKVRESELATVLTAIKQFLDAIRTNEPDTVYEAYQASDRLSFMNIMHFTDVAVAEKHSKSVYTDKFVSVLYPRCETTPVFTDISPLNGL